MTTPHEDILEWSVHPLRERPGRAVGTCLIILACGLLVSVAVGDPTGGVLAGGAAILFLVLMLNRFFLPSYYRMDAVGIAVRYPIGTRSLRWADLRRFPHNESGGYLSTRERGGLFDSRGISVLFADRGAEIVPRIKAAMDRAGEDGE